MLVPTILCCLVVLVDAKSPASKVKKAISQNVTAAVKSEIFGIAGNSSLSTSEIQSALNAWGDSHGEAVGVSWVKQLNLRRPSAPSRRIRLSSRNSRTRLSSLLETAEAPLAAAN